jgi:hypothetical protein
VTPRPRDPVRLLVRRHRALCLDAAGPLEIAAGLEAAGLTDRGAAPYRHPDVFSLAEELHRRVPPLPIQSAPPVGLDPDPWAALDLGTPLTARAAALRERARRAAPRWAAPLVLATVAAAVPPGPLSAALLAMAGPATARALTRPPAGPATRAASRPGDAAGRGSADRPQGRARPAPGGHADSAVAPTATRAPGRSRLAGPAAGQPVTPAGAPPGDDPTATRAPGRFRLARAVGHAAGAPPGAAPAVSAAARALGRLPGRAPGRAHLARAVFARAAFALAWALAPLCVGAGAAGAALVWAAPLGAGLTAWVWRWAGGVFGRARSAGEYAAGVWPVGAAAVVGFGAAQAAVVWAAGPGWVAVAAGAALFAAGLLPPGPGAAGALGAAAVLAARAACPSPLLTAACAVTAAVLAAYAVGALSRASACAAALDLFSSDVPTRSKP